MIGAPARTPPDLSGLRPEWSRVLFIANDAADGAADAGTSIGVHVLDVGPRDAELTLVCVHGNPTWSYLWREVIAQAPAGVRVVAIDQVGMGYSARPSSIRRLADRISDLDAIVGQLGITGQLALLAHDWGGPVALGWASGSGVERAAIADRLAAIVLTNTAVHQPAHRAAPRLISTARAPMVRGTACVRTSAFLRGTTAISTVDRATARAFRAPYDTAALRHSIGDFVADIPLEENHPSMATLRQVASGLDSLTDVPTLLVWGMRDPVFSVHYLDDLRHRMPHADVQQLPDAGHLVLEDRPDAIANIWEWVCASCAQNPTTAPEDEEQHAPAHPGSRLHELAKLSTPAITTRSTNGWHCVSWSQLDDRVLRLAAGFRAKGIAPGDRVAVLIPPSAELLAVVYALWHLGATVVVIDAAHKPPAMIRSLRGARLDHVVAVRRALPIITAVRVPGTVIWHDKLATVAGSVEPVDLATAAPAQAPQPDDDAVVVFTSGATGAAKPVAYSWSKLAATADVLREAYGLNAEDVLVAAFAPWAVMGPLVGMASVIPDMDASRPGTLTAQALGEAVERAGGTVMWASPAAIRSVLAGAPPKSSAREQLRAHTATLRLLLIAGAPVSRELVAEVTECWPELDVRTPYGMTEVLPATDVRASEILEAQPAGGVLVGTPLPGVQVAVAPLGAEGKPSEELQSTADVLGEVALRARHGKSRYDAGVFVERESGRNPGWHRTGDIGRIDDYGRLRIEGRLAHVITTMHGPVGPVSIEQAVESALDGHGLQAAAVGVGPVGAQVIVVVLAPSRATGRRARMRLASFEDVERVRASVPSIAAVLWRDGMPVDIRHGAKVDRALLAKEAARLLAGHQ